MKTKEKKSKTKRMKGERDGKPPVPNSFSSVILSRLPDDSSHPSSSFSSSSTTSTTTTTTAPTTTAYGPLSLLAPPPAATYFPSFLLPSLSCPCQSIRLKFFHFSFF
jgi:hypothetical protein